MPLRITIAGDIGSGKSTVAKRLAELAGVEPLSTGGIQRQLAQKRGVSVLELNRLAENDASIDREIDSYLVRLSQDTIVVESRMAWHFVPDTLKVYLYISDVAAARRIVGAQRIDEGYQTIAEATLPILDRRKSEILRFKKYYEVDIDDLRNYDLVVDTTYASIDDVVAQVIKPHDFQKKPACLMDPRNLVPTRSGKPSGAVEESVRTKGFDLEKPIATLYVDHVFYVVDGHARAAAALRTGTKFVTCKIKASNDEAYTGDWTARQYVRKAIHPALISAWQETVGFRYEGEMWKGRAASDRRPVTNNKPSPSS
jgi:predicted cytidylate kinase